MKVQADLCVRGPITRPVLRITQAPAKSIAGFAIALCAAIEFEYELTLGRDLQRGWSRGSRECEYLAGIQYRESGLPISRQYGEPKRIAALIQEWFDGAVCVDCSYPKKEEVVIL